MILWIFNSTPEAKKFIDSKNIELVQWNRIVCLWTEQTTYEWNKTSWKNINGIYIKGEKGQDWLDWKDGRDAKEVNEAALLNQLTETIRLDGKFQIKIKWERGEKWDPGEKWDVTIPNLSEIIEMLVWKLVNNDYFIEKCAGENGINGKDGYGHDGKHGKDGKSWTNGKDGIDGRDWWTVVFIENQNNVQLLPRELGIDAQKNIYLNRNNTIIKL